MEPQLGDEDDVVVLGAAWQGDSASVQGTTASTTVRNLSEDTGSTGQDNHFGSSWPQSLNPYNVNRVNTEWIARTRSGSRPDWVGNTGQAVYLWPMGSTGHKFYSVTVLHMCTVAGSTC